MNFLRVFFINKFDITLDEIPFKFGLLPFIDVDDVDKFLPE